MSANDELAFLGEEFLTWLWFVLENEGGDFEIGPRRTVGVAMDDFIVFAPREDDETEQTLRKGMPTRSREARAALRNGRRLRKARLVIAEGEATYGVVIDGPTLQLQSAKLPDDGEEATTPAERNASRMQSFLALHEIVDGLYRRFLAERLQPDYAKTRATSQARWMAAE
jgi:hypothetical protein